MLIKIINCIVNEDLKTTFHIAQSKWSELESISGFIAQVGGWNIKNKHEAIIIGMWRSLDDYNYFMTEIHDQIIGTSNQSKSFESIDVSLWKIDGNLNYKDLRTLDYIELIDKRKNNITEDNLKCKNISIIELKNENVRKQVLFQNEPGDISDNIEAQVRLIKEWTVVKNPWIQ